MTKDIRWLIVVLLFALEECVASSQVIRLQVRGPHQRRNTIYLQPLRDAQYLPPIPVSVPPNFRDKPQSDSESSYEQHSSQSPWIPIQNNEEEIKKNVYIPPIQPPPMIITRRPVKNTFHIPVMKSIQVSQTRPNIQTTGYIRKNMVKMHATRTTTENPRLNNFRPAKKPQLKIIPSTEIPRFKFPPSTDKPRLQLFAPTENPRLKVLGSLAESTVQTLLNFTPVDDGWRPKFPSTSRSTAVPKFNFGRNLGTKVDKYLNYTGVRFGKVNSVMESMPPNGDEVRLMRNETNFVMRFTPEDIKYSAVEVKSENVDSPFLTSSPGVKYLIDEFKDHKIYFDGLPDKQKTTGDLIKEGNIPYQGHKSTMQDSNLGKSTTNAARNGYSEDRRTIFDVFPGNHNSQNYRFQDQGSFVNDPYNNVKSTPSTRVKDTSLQLKDKTFLQEPFNSQRIKSEITTDKSFNKDYRTYFNEPPNSKLATDQQVKSNLPNEEYSTPDNGPSVLENPIYDNTNKENFSHRGPTIFFDTPSSKPADTASVKLADTSIKANGNINFDDPPKINSNNFSKNYDIVPHYIGNIAVNTQPYGGTYNAFPNHFRNRTRVKDEFTVTEVPLLVEWQYNKDVSNKEKTTLFDTPSSKPAIASSNKQADTPSIKPNENAFFDNSEINSKNILKNYMSPYKKNADSVAINTQIYGETYNLFPDYFRNRTHVKDEFMVSEVPLSAKEQYAKADFSNQPKYPSQNHGSVQENSNQANENFENLDLHKYSPKSHSVISIIQGDVSSANKNKNEEYKNKDQISKPVFDEAPKLKKIALKNPPPYLQFGDDFYKSVTPENFEDTSKEAKQLGAFSFSAKDRSGELKNKAETDKTKEVEKTKMAKDPKLFAPKTPASKVEYLEQSQSVNSKPLRENADDIYFQPVLSQPVQKKTQEQRFQNYNSEQTIVQSTGLSKDKPRTSEPNSSDNINLIPKNRYDFPKEKQKNGNNWTRNGETTSKITIYSPEDIRKNTGRAVSGGTANELPELITPPAVITVIYDSQDTGSSRNKKVGLNRFNRTENYVIQHKPALIPESTGRPRKPKITISTGMLAGILIAALVFLGFLTGSMVYAFHQWKFSRSRTDRKKKKKKVVRTPGFPPEYLDETFAGNTYIHNNIFLPTPQNLDERNPADPDNSSVIGDEVMTSHEQPSTSSRSRRHHHRTFRDIRDD